MQREDQLDGFNTADSLSSCVRMEMNLEKKKYTFTNIVDLPMNQLCAD